MKTPAVCVYLEGVLEYMARYCDSADISEQGKFGPAEGCRCLTCRLREQMEAVLTAEWEERCGKGTGTTPQSVGDAVAGEPVE